MYFAIDGNSTGKYIEKMLLENDLLSLSQFSESILRALQEFTQSIIEMNGEIIMSGGDNILARIPDTDFATILSRFKPLSIGTYTFSMAISSSAQGAYLGLKYAKAKGIRYVKVEPNNDGRMEFYIFAH